MTFASAASDNNVTVQKRFEGGKAGPRATACLAGSILAGAFQLVARTQLAFPSTTSQFSDWPSPPQTPI